MSISKSYEEIICPHCQFPLSTGTGEIIECSECNKKYHATCWDEINGCIIYNCNGKPKTSLANMIGSEPEDPTIETNDAVNDKVEEPNADKVRDDTVEKDSAQVKNEIVLTMNVEPITKEENTINKTKERVQSEDSKREDLNIENSNDKEPKKSFLTIYIAAIVFVVIGALIIGFNANSRESTNKDDIAVNGSLKNENIADKLESIDFKGGIYTGDLVNAKPHGQGKWIHIKEGEYVGEWVNGLKQGVGVFTWPNDRQYEGQWKNDKRHGEGKWTHPNGGSYIGDWENDILHGYGTRVWANGDKYVGNYLYNKRHGDGVFNYGNGDKYEGSWEDGLYHGQGTKNYANGDIYVGNWKNGLYHGEGTKTYADGRVHDGEWMKGELRIEPPVDSQGPEIVWLKYRNTCEQKIYLHINGRFASVIHPGSEFGFRVRSGNNEFEIYDQNNIFVRRYIFNITARNDGLIDVYQFSECHLLPVESD